MRLLILPLFLTFGLADETCSIVEECNVDIVQRLSVLENAGRRLITDVEYLKAENDDLKNQVENVENEITDIKAENTDLKTQVENLRNINGELANDVLAIEKIVIPGKIPASCQEHQDRGQTETGIYQIKPTADIEPFSVTCEFRKCYLLSNIPIIFSDRPSS